MVPIHGPVQSLVDGQESSPTEAVPGLARIKLQVLRLMGSIWVDLQFNTSSSPTINHPLDQCQNWNGVCIARSKIPGLRVASRISEKLFPQHQISRNRFDHMLPWPNRIRASNQNRFIGDNCSRDVGQQPVRRPIATSDDISSPSSGYPHPLLGEKCVSIGGGD